MNTDPRPEFDKNFLSALLAEDELGVVIRAHIYIEASLNEFNEACIPVPQHIPNLRFQQRIDLACALGLKPEYGPALKVLGHMRNAFAHKLNTKLTRESVEKLYCALSKTAKEAVEQSFRKTKSQLLAEKGPDFQNLEPKDQFVLIAVSLNAMLLVAKQRVSDIAT
jgi:hypothetical protein